MKINVDESLFVFKGALEWKDLNTIAMYNHEDAAELNVQAD